MAGQGRLTVPTRGSGPLARRFASAIIGRAAIIADTNHGVAASFRHSTSVMLTDGPGSHSVAASYRTSSTRSLARTRCRSRRVRARRSDRRDRTNDLPTGSVRRGPATTRCRPRSGRSRSAAGAPGRATRSRIPAATSLRSRSARIGRETPRSSRIASNRRMPRNTLRTISIDQRSPTTDATASMPPLSPPTLSSRAPAPPSRAVASIDGDPTSEFESHTHARTVPSRSPGTTSHADMHGAPGSGGSFVAAACRGHESGWLL